MFRLMKTALNTAVRNPVKNTIVKREFTRNFLYLCRVEDNVSAKAQILNKPSISCSCGCGIRGVHSKSKQ